MRRALVVAVALAAVLLWLAGHLELAEDEAYYWVWSRRLAAGYFDHPPAIAWVIRASTALFGDGERGVRAGTVLLGAATLLLAAAGSRDRLLAALALGTMPLMALGGLLATPDVPLAFAWALGLWAALGERWLLVGLAAGLAMLSKYTGVLLLPLVVLADPAALRRRGPWLAAAVALLVYAPNAAWNLAHDAASWRFQLRHVAAAHRRLDFLGAQFALTGGFGFLAALGWWFSAGRAGAWNIAAGRGDRAARLCWWTSLPLLLVGLWAGGEANWAAPAWIAAMVGVARHGGRPARLAWVGAGVGAVLSGLVMVHAVHPLVTLPVDPTDRLRGGRVLGESVRAWGVEPVLTERYQEAALIAYYGRVRAWAVPGLGRPDQYDLWPEPEPAHALFVRVWADGRPIPLEAAGYEHHGANVVTAWAPTPDPLVDRPVARWQVYEVRKAP